jgi:UDP-2,3-diacylglucosamine hydrolase
VPFSQAASPDAPSSVPALGPMLQAPAHWRLVDFISDLHLQPSEPATVQAWERYMAHTQADAVFILGDLFEVWIGDDVIDAAAQSSLDADSFERRCVRVLQAAARQREVFFMHGNRDFLIGSDFIQTCGIRLLDDPTVLGFAGQRWLLSHGDALCLDDTDYMQFRAQVRSPQWQQAFLAKPLAERKAIALSLRQQSEARKQSGAIYADVDAPAAAIWLQAAHSTHLIHGHTHKPADHEFGAGLQRTVLSDWDAAATPPRAQVLRLSLNAQDPAALVRPQRLSPELA